jgi:small subunit ribosomal protein S4e
MSIEKHQGSFDIAHVKDVNGEVFATRLSNVFVIGDGKTPAISLPKGEGLKLSLIEMRDARLGDEVSEAGDDAGEDSD